MEKILLALDPRQLNMHVVDFACYVAGLNRSQLTVILLQNEVHEPARDTGREDMRQAGQGDLAVLKTKLAEKAAGDNLSVLASACKNRGIKIWVHENIGEPLTEVISESRFADMLVVDPEMSFGSSREAVPSHFIKEVLTNSECPVVIAPYTFNGIEEIVFAYDGGASATFAMKQFSYLFPKLSDLKLTILQVSEEQKVPLIEKKKLIEFLQMHYSSIGFRILEGKASDELFGFLHDKKNIFVVIGAYGRKNLRGVFRHSTADLLLKTVNLPVFIAHKG
jgi:hypothetical protein